MSEETIEKPEKQVKKEPYILYTAEDPSRPPSWRYERVQYLLNKDEDSFALIDDDDRAIRFFFLFCQELAKAKEPEEIFLVKKKYPGIYEALTLRKYTSLSKLGVLEGFLLTDSPLEWICNKFSLHPLTLCWYDQLFLDVWDRRESTFWVENNVVSPNKYVGHNDFKRSPDWDRACAIRKMGYYAGTIVLELFYTGFYNDTKPDNRDLASVFIQRFLETNISNEGALMASSKRFLNKTEGEFLAMALKLASEAKAAGNQEIIQNVARALSAVAPLVGEDVKEHMTKFADQNSDAAAILVSAAELRTIDQMRLHLGQELPSETKFLLEEFKTARSKENNETEN